MMIDPANSGISRFAIYTVPKGSQMSLERISELHQIFIQCRVIIGVIKFSISIAIFQSVLECQCDK